MHLLGRRYALTATSYKYVDIGIAVGPSSIVQWVLGDSRGNQLIFYFDTWSKLMAGYADIEKMLQDPLPSTPLSFGDLSISICVMYGSKMFKLVVAEKSLYMKPTTLKYLFELKHCISYRHDWLGDNIFVVNSKFTQFLNIIKSKHCSDVEQVKAAIRDSDYFDTESIIDVELLACALPDIIKHI